MGPALYSDDLAADVRSDFRALIGEGYSVAAAVEKLIKEYASALDDPDEAPVFWLALAKLRAQILSPPPAAKPVPRPVKSSTEWIIGEIVAFRLRSGRLALVRVIGHHEDTGGRSAVCELVRKQRDGEWIVSRTRPGRELVVARRYQPWTRRRVIYEVLDAPSQ